MFISNELKRIENVEHISNVREYFLEVLYHVVVDMISDKAMFSIDDFSAIYYDEYTLETQCHKDIFSKIYLEIDQPLNYKPIIQKKLKKIPNKLNFPELYITIEDIQECLYNNLILNLDQNNLIWKEEYSVCIKATINDENNQVFNYYFRIIPCLTHYNENNKRGLLYKKNGGIEIEYPEISIENYFDKNEKTNNLYRDTILIFKNILLKEKNITTLPQEIIEIMLYNVPNEMFKNDNKATLINIINYLRNNSIKNFQTLDEQDFAFTSIYRSLSLIYVKHIIKIIEKYLINN